MRVSGNSWFPLKMTIEQSLEGIKIPFQFCWWVSLSFRDETFARTFFVELMKPQRAPLIYECFISVHSTLHETFHTFSVCRSVHRFLLPKAQSFFLPKVCPLRQLRNSSMHMSFKFRLKYFWRNQTSMEIIFLKLDFDENIVKGIKFP